MILDKESIVIGTPLHILFVGRLAAEKGVSHLLQAMVLLKNQNVMLNLVGQGEGAEQLRRLAQSLNISDRVQFHGFVPQGSALWQVYRQNDLFVLPSLQDQQPKVLLEAMSQGLPVIATEVGGVPTIVQDGVNGVLIPPGRPEAIASAVCRLQADPGLCARLAGNGLALARQHTVEAETAKMMRVVGEHFDFRSKPDDWSTEDRSCADL